MSHGRSTAVLLALLAVAPGGCGLAAHAGTSGVTIRITRDFGARLVRVIHVPPTSRSLSALALLQREARVEVGRGAVVRSIDGVTAASGQRWSHFINGIGERDRTPAQAIEQQAPVVHAGDELWWDLRVASAAALVPAVVGAYPEPFRHGLSGKRFPVTLECASDMGTACRRVSDALAGLGVPAATQELGTGSGQDTISVLVGTWAELRSTLLGAVVSAGPSASGIYVRFSASGAAMGLLDARGRTVQRLGAGAGLVAATRETSGAPTSGAPTWLITGTDSSGVDAAAARFAEPSLQGRYALVVAGGTPLPLPAR